MSASFKECLNDIKNAFKTGNTAELTFRPALKDLSESLKTEFPPTNEPKRIACSAPDNIVTQKGIIIGTTATATATASGP